MVFFAEDVHVLVRASIDGRVYVWKIQKGQMKMTSHRLQGRLLLRFRSQDKGNLFILEFVGPFLTPGVVLCFLLFLCCALLALGLHLEFFLWWLSVVAVPLVEVEGCRVFG
ncbi:hypothetical protein LXL04_020530 [Taraxacum kok-saghyz]